MTKSRKIKAHAIIHTAATAAGSIGAGLAQLPCADSIPLSGIQVTMVVSLGGVFGKKITKTAAKAIVLAFASSYAGRTASQLVAGWVPGFGNVMNATTAATLTEAMGWYVVRQFDQGKDIIRTDGGSAEEAVELESEKKSPVQDSFEISPPIFNETDLEDVIEPMEK